MASTIISKEIIEEIPGIVVIAAIAAALLLLLALILLGGLLAALLCGKVGKRSNKRLVKSHKKLRSV